MMVQTTANSVKTEYRELLTTKAGRWLRISFPKLGLKSKVKISPYKEDNLF